MLVSGVSAISLLPQRTRAVREVFSQPPFHWRDDESELHRERLARLLDNPSLGIASPWSAERPIGFAYGSTYEGLGLPVGAG